MDLREGDDGLKRFFPGLVKIYTATSNKAKIEGIKSAFRRAGVDVEVAALPGPPDAVLLSLEATIAGALRRAAAAWRGEGLAIGVEAGFFTAAGRHLGVHAAAIYDGRASAVGMSPAFEIWGELFAELALRGFDALAEKGVDKERGLIYALTGGAMERAELVAEAVYLALISYRRGAGFSWSR